MNLYKEKYIKYKNKYLELKGEVQSGGGDGILDKLEIGYHIICSNNTRLFSRLDYDNKPPDSAYDNTKKEWDNKYNDAVKQLNESCKVFTKQEILTQIDIDGDDGISNFYKEQQMQYELRKKRERMLRQLYANHKSLNNKLYRELLDALYNSKTEINREPNKNMSTIINNHYSLILNDEQYSDIFNPIKECKIDINNIFGDEEKKLSDEEKKLSDEEKKLSDERKTEFDEKKKKFDKKKNTYEKELKRYTKENFIKIVEDMYKGVDEYIDFSNYEMLTMTGPYKIVLRYIMTKFWAKRDYKEDTIDIALINKFKAKHISIGFINNLFSSQYEEKCRLTVEIINVTLSDLIYHIMINWDSNIIY